MAQIFANDLRLEAESYGEASDPAVLLIRGLGSQMISWPDCLIDGLVADGLRVLTFDNRDVGLSQKLGPCDNAGSEVPVYRIEDMADDAISVLDAFGVGKAHVAGMSLGGMITQALLAQSHDRLLSATIIMSSSMRPDLGERDAEAARLLTLQPDDPTNSDDVIDVAMQGQRYWGSPAFSRPETGIKAQFRRAHARNYCPGGVARQWLAASHWVANEAALRKVTCPVQVMHGLNDTLLPASHGRDIASLIPNASLLEVAGMGHDLEGGVAHILRHAITGLARSAKSDASQIADS